jgi:hypothetical protein
MKPRSKWKPYHRPGGGRLKTEAEMAALLGEQQRTLRHWRLRGIVPCITLGFRTLRYDPDRVMAALAKRETKGSSRRFFFQQPL